MAKDHEFKTVAEDMIKEHTLLRERACERLISETKEAIEMAQEVIWKAQREKYRKPLVPQYGLHNAVETVLDRVSRMYRIASEIDNETFLMYKLADKSEDIEIEKGE